MNPPSSLRRPFVHYHFQVFLLAMTMMPRGLGPGAQVKHRTNWSGESWWWWTCHWKWSECDIKDWYFDIILSLSWLKHRHQQYAYYVFCICLLTNKYQKYKLVKSSNQLITTISSMPVGGLLGAASTGFVADCFGRWLIELNLNACHCFGRCFINRYMFHV